MGLLRIHLRTHKREVIQRGGDDQDAVMRHETECGSGRATLFGGVVPSHPDAMICITRSGETPERSPLKVQAKIMSQVAAMTPASRIAITLRDDGRT